MAVNIPGMIVMVFFYLLVLATGMWAFFKSRRKQKKSAATGMEMALLGNRSLNWVVGIFTMTGERIDKINNWNVLDGWAERGTIFIPTITYGHGSGQKNKIAGTGD